MQLEDGQRLDSSALPRFLKLIVHVYKRTTANALSYERSRLAYVRTRTRRGQLARLRSHSHSTSAHAKDYHCDYHCDNVVTVL